jgi:hypothetical protein
MHPPLLPGHTLSVTPEKNQLRVIITRDSDSRVVFNNLVKDVGVLNQNTSGGTPVTGTFWQPTQPVSFTWTGLTDAQLRETPVPVSLESTTRIGTVTPALVSDTSSSVPSSTTTQILAAANTNRRSLTIFNNSTAILYVCFSETATQARAKVPIGAGGFYEMPTGVVYTGIVSGIWTDTNGNASIHEGI